MKNFQRQVLVTGGAGFIGSHVVRLLVNNYPQYRIINLDKLTYAGNLANLRDVEDLPNYSFVRGDIVDGDFIQSLFDREQIDAVIHLAAESHVDRSIANPMDFVMTNVVGTVNLLNAARHAWKDAPESNDRRIFYHVSTDEVYGTLGESGMFTETTPYDPQVLSRLHVRPDGAQRANLPSRQEHSPGHRLPGWDNADSRERKGHRADQFADV